MRLIKTNFFYFFYYQVLNIIQPRLLKETNDYAFYLF